MVSSVAKCTAASLKQAFPIVRDEMNRLVPLFYVMKFALLQRFAKGSGPTHSKSYPAVCSRMREN